MQQVAINRSYSPAKVCDVILAAFGCKDFSILECAKGGYLLRAEDKELTSQLAIDRRGALYLCETSNVRVSILVGMHGCIIRLIMLRVLFVPAHLMGELRAQKSQAPHLHRNG